MPVACSAERIALAEDFDQRGAMVRVVGVQPDPAIRGLGESRQLRKARRSLEARRAQAPLAFERRDDLIGLQPDPRLWAPARDDEVRGRAERFADGAGREAQDVVHLLNYAASRNASS